MPSPFPRRRSANRKAQRLRRTTRQSTPGLTVLCIVLYGIAGFILIGFTGVPWLWMIALAGVLLQVVGLAGPQSLQRFKWFRANLLVLVSTGGAAIVAIALAVALNHQGTDQLDDLTMAGAMLEIALLSGLAVLVAAVCSVVTAALGDRLLRRLPSGAVMTRLGLTCLVGLALGGGLGVLSY